MKRNPWEKWFFDDYAKDPGLKASSLPAQGLWKRMLCLAHECEERGFLGINNRAMDATEIASMCSVPLAEIATVPKLIDELERNKVFSRDRRGIIYCRRMVRATNRSTTNYQNGIQGGHQNRITLENEMRMERDNADLEPDVSQSASNGFSDSPPRESGRVFQKPEARSQKPEADSLAPDGATLFVLEPAKPACDWPRNYRELFWERYPRKIGKTAAMRALDRVRRASPCVLWGKLMEGLSVYVRHAKTVEMRFVKHAATWINQGCWDDNPGHHGGGNERRNPIGEAAERAIAGNIAFAPRPAGVAGRVRDGQGATVVRLLPKGPE